jgi:hypothetical protein
MKPNMVFQGKYQIQTLVCVFPYAALKAFIPAQFIPSETHFSTGYE